MVAEIENIYNSKIENLETLNWKTVKCERTNGGGEGKYTCLDLRKWFFNGDIIIEINTAYYPESNGSAERLNRTLWI